MQIGEVAMRTGISIRMLRYYEEQGLIAPARTASGYRDYGLTELDILERIRKLGACGMTLPVISQFLPCAINGRSAFEPCDELRAVLQHHISEVDSQMAELAGSRELLSALLDEVDTRNN